MRFRFAVGSLGVAALLGALGLLAGACSSSSGSGSSSGGTEGGTDPGTSPDGGPGDGASGGDSRVPAPPNDCKLAEMTGIVDITPTFLTYDPPTTVPPSMKGGTLNGKYKIDKATVYLPTQTKGVADPTKSTGTVNGWAVFNGKNYRIYLKAALTITTVIGPQAQNTDVASQGGFTVASAALTIDSACDVTPPIQAEYTFTDDGSGKATLLVKVPGTYGDSYMQLEATKN